MKARLVKESVPGYENGIPWSGKDVIKAKPIGKIITKEWELQGGFKFPKEEYEVIEIVERDGLDDIYITNKWYKEHKRIPQLIPAIFVEKYIPYEQ